MVKNIYLFIFKPVRFISKCLLQAVNRIQLDVDAGNKFAVCFTRIDFIVFHIIQHDFVTKYNVRRYA